MLGTIDWREGLLRRVGHVYVGIFVATMLLFLFLGRITALLWFGFALMAGRSVAWVLEKRSVGYRARAWVMILALVIASASFYLFAGLNPGPVLACGFCLVLTALLLGRRALVMILLAMIAYLLVITAIIWSGRWVGPIPAVVGIPAADVWLRATIVSALFWIGTAFSVLYVVRAMERNVARLREKEQQQRAAEKARREAEAKAMQSQKLEAIGQLAAGVAHDFNNALLVMRGWNQLLRDSDSPELKKKANTAIGQAIDQSEHLARQLLAFGRKQVRTPRYLDFADVVATTVETLGRVVSAPIELSVMVRQRPYVFADETQLQQLLFNLVLNARDALAEDGKITVTLRDDDSGRADGEAGAGLQRVVLEVEDNGEGMNESVKSRIFDPFYTTKEMGKGTGLGLSTVFGIVQQSEATIDVWSEPGKGSRFSIAFSCVEVAPVVDKSKRPAVVSGRRQGRIMVLEDDPLARDLLIFALSQQGFTVIDVQDGTAALELLQQAHEPIDLLSADTVFPGAALNDVIQAFKKANPEGQILICSGYVPEDIAVQGIESGRYEYLAKPFTATRLVRKILSMLGDPG